MGAETKQHFNKHRNQDHSDEKEGGVAEKPSRKNYFLLKNAASVHGQWRFFVCAFSVLLEYVNNLTWVLVKNFIVNSSGYVIFLFTVPRLNAYCVPPAKFTLHQKELPHENAKPTDPR